MTETKFEGYIVPTEKTALTDTQATLITSLPRVVYRNNRLEEFVGDVQSVSTDVNAPRIMISPSALFGFVRKTASENGVSPWDVTQAIRSYGIEDPEKLKAIDKRYKETIAYVSDIHGGNQDLYDRLNGIAENPPEAVIFTGDIIGTKNFEDLQRLFYNWLNNHSRNELLRSNPDATDQEILSYADTKPPEDGFNLKKGFLKLREFELGLTGKTAEEISEELEQLTDHDIADEIRRYAKYVHYGHYASNLPIETRQALANGLEENARRIMVPIKEIQAKGTTVAVMEGNWDARAPIDFVPEVETAEPLDEGKRLFRPKKFFEDNGIAFYDALTPLETKTTLQILLPFDAIVGFGNILQDEIDNVKETVERARSERKSIVMVSHGEPNWRIHNMTVTNPVPTGEHLQVVTGLSKAISLFRPDEIVYGHLHEPLTNEAGEEQNSNTKYALEIGDDGTATLIERPEDFSDNQTVASHLQFRKTGELKSSRRDTRRKISGFGGNRQPARVK